MDWLAPLLPGGLTSGYVTISPCDMCILESLNIVVNLTWETSQSHRR